MIVIIPSPLNAGFKEALSPAFTASAKGIKFIESGHEVPCVVANSYINGYQNRVEHVERVKNGDLFPDTIGWQLADENAYKIIDCANLTDILSALTSLKPPAKNVRFYFAVYNKSVTVAIVGDDGRNILMPQDSTNSYYVYENFGGGGSIDSWENDLPCDPQE